MSVSLRPEAATWQRKLETQIADEVRTSNANLKFNTISLIGQLQLYPPLLVATRCMLLTKHTDTTRVHTLLQRFFGWAAQGKCNMENKSC